MNWEKNKIEIGLWAFVVVIFIIVLTCSSCSIVHHADSYEIAFCTREHLKCFDRDSNIVKIKNPDHLVMFAGDSIFLRDEFKYLICRTP